jgi:hypothetical protein
VGVQRPLKGADYPARGEKLASTAEDNDTPAELVKLLRNLGEEFSDPDRVMATLKRS